MTRPNPLTLVLNRPGLIVAFCSLLLILGGCVSPGQMAKLDPAALPRIDGAPAKAGDEKAAGKSGSLPGVIAAHPPKDRYSDPMIAASAGVPVATEAETQAAAAAPTIGDLAMQPTDVSAHNNSLFSNRQSVAAGQMQAGRVQGGQQAGPTGSIVPQDMPVRRGINPSLASVYSAPKRSQAESSSALAMAAESPPLTASAAPNSRAYDPAEPLSAYPPAPAPAPSAANKRFSLMRVLGQSGS